MLPLRARVDLGVMEMKGYSTFPKASGLTRGAGILPPFEAMQSVYSTVPADCAGPVEGLEETENCGVVVVIIIIIIVLINNLSNEFCHSTDHRLKIRGSEKIDKYLNIARGTVIQL